MELAQFFENFANDPNNQDLIAIYRDIAEREAQNEIGISTRGYERRGPYSYNDKSGLNYLHDRLIFHGVLGLQLVVLGIVAAISTAITAGASATISALCLTLAGFVFGNMASANNALAKASRLMEQGKSYTIYQNYILFGTVTIGYDVE